jgi:hypothetical protein
LVAPALEQTAPISQVIHFLVPDVIMFEAVYGGDCDRANFTELPSNSSTLLDASGHAALHPSSEFPSFAAPDPDATTTTPSTPATRLTGDDVGFFTTGGVMNYAALALGVGLHGGARAHDAHRDGRLATSPNCTAFLLAA